MRTRAGIVLQARYGSSRLRGKALEMIGGRTILEHCLRRLIRGGVAHVVLATTCEPDDDALATIARGLNVPVFRGSTDDVLGRLAEAARTFELDPVIRATGDNPAVDVQAAGRVLAALRATGADYGCEEGLPVGAAVEGMTAAALYEAERLAHTPYDREHVTTFVRRRSDRFRVADLMAPPSLVSPLLRLTVDTAEDLAWVRELFSRSQSDDPSLAALISASGSRRTWPLPGDPARRVPLFRAPYSRRQEVA